MLRTRGRTSATGTEWLGIPIHQCTEERANVGEDVISLQQPWYDDGTRGPIYVQSVGRKAASLHESVRNDEAWQSHAFIVLYQKGLHENVNCPHRTHYSILSRFLIVVDGQDGTSEMRSNVPWRNFCWFSGCSKNTLIEKTECVKGCTQKNCACLFGNATRDTVKVVCMQEECGEFWFQWYVSFACDGDVLTRVPPKVVQRIRNDVDNGDVSRHCTCGECRHPLLQMHVRNYGEEEVEEVEDEEEDEEEQEEDSGECDLFSIIAAHRFAQYKKAVTNCVSKELRTLRNNVSLSNFSSSQEEQGDESKCAHGPPCDTAQCPNHAVDSTEDMPVCSVCFEQGVAVSTELCPGKRCTLPVCHDCNVKMRGLCPLCDRTKLGSRASFLCAGCNCPEELSKFGFRCIQCQRPKLCTRCFKAYGDCFYCRRIPRVRPIG